VLDLVSQVRDVVLMNVYLGLGNSRGVGILEWGVYESGEGNGNISLRATWVRGGRILSQQGGFQVSKGRMNGEQKEIEESKKQGDYSGLGVIYARVHNECLWCLEDTSCLYAL
jgi:hypothetical protein